MMIDSTGESMRIFLIGFMGSGKTHWGKLLAEALQLPFYDLDREITNAEQKSITEIFTQKGEEYFRYKEKEVLEALIEDHASFIISCGGGTPCFFDNIDVMKESGQVLWLNTPVDVLIKRLLIEKDSRPLIKNIPESELKNHILHKLQSRRLYYQQADVHINENDITLEQLVQIVNNA